MAIHLELAADHDVGRIFEWRNDPFLVERSTSKKLVSWEEHQAWFALALKDESKKLYVISDDVEKLGLVRFDRISPEIGVISAYVLEEFTGKGHGVEAIKAACKMIAKVWEIRKICAFVRSDNQAGKSGFLKAGFVRDDAPAPEAHVGLAYWVNETP